MPRNIIFVKNLETKIFNLLTYPSPNVFKEYILYLLSSENVIKIYFQLKASSHPNLQIERFLAPERFTNKNPIYVWNLVNSMLHVFDQEHYPFLRSIVWCQNIDPIILDQDLHQNQNIVVKFPDQKLYSLRPHRLSCGQEIFVCNDRRTCKFQAGLKVNDMHVELIAQGFIFEVDFPDHLEFVWKAYKAKIYQKLFLKFYLHG
jgi:hypothetical protein